MKLGPALFVLFASIAFATSGPLARLARPEHPLFAAFGRVAIASLLLLLFNVRSVLAARRLPLAVILGGTLLAAHFACFLWGIDTTSLPAAIALVSLEPLSVVVWAWALHGDRPTRGEAIGVLVATLGGVIVSRGAGSGEHRLLGDGLVLIAVALYGLYVAVVRRTRDVLPATTAAALVYFVSAIVLGVAVAVVPMQIVWPVPQKAALAILGLALIPTLIGHTAVQAASRVLSPSTVALVSPGESVLGIAIAATMMHARPSLIEAIGAIVIVAGATIAIVTAPQPEGGTSPPPMPVQGGVTQAQR
jgi:drug/metabolite transporter (DMT)-like permease